METGLLQFSSQEGGVSETLSERLRRPLEIKVGPVLDSPRPRTALLLNNMYVARNRKGAIPASHSNHVACFTRLANHAVEWQGTQDYFVEGGCCSDTTYIYLEGKKLQHSALKSALRSSGHDVILTYTGILGFFGSTDTGNLKTLMTLGIEYAAAKSLFGKTHQHTVTCTLNLNKNCTYRQLYIELSIHAEDYGLPPYRSIS